MLSVSMSLSPSSSSSPLLSVKSESKLSYLDSSNDEHQEQKNQSNRSVITMASPNKSDCNQQASFNNSSNSRSTSPLSASLDEQSSSAGSPFRLQLKCGSPTLHNSNENTNNLEAKRNQDLNEISQSAPAMPTEVTATKIGFKKNCKKLAKPKKYSQQINHNNQDISLESIRSPSESGGEFNAIHDSSSSQVAAESPHQLDYLSPGRSESVTPPATTSSIRSNNQHQELETKNQIQYKTVKKLNCNFFLKNIYL
jgi:hypothetical protein